MATKKNEAAPTAAEPINETAEVMPESKKKSGDARKASASASGKKKIYIRKPAGVINDKGKIVGLNGKMYSVPYDKEVEVPEGVYEILKRSEQAAETAEKVNEQLAGAGELRG